MSASLVVDASVAIKWIVPEPDSPFARALKGRFRLIAPQLIYAECSNILWKKWRKGELSGSEAAQLGTAIDGLDLEIASMRGLAATATALSIRLNHPAYDCFYLALAVLENCRLVTSDGRFLRILGQSSRPELLSYCMSLADSQN